MRSALSVALMTLSLLVARGAAATLVWSGF
jgi:hypothetical protein